MEFRILGPLEVVREDTTPAELAPRQKTLLGLLLINAGTVVSVDRIVDDLWGDDPPASRDSAIRFHVSKLRQALQPGVAVARSVIFTRSPGYGVAVEGASFDAATFERLAATGASLIPSRPKTAGTVLRDALSMWRGPALHDFAYDEFAQPEIARLEEARLVAIEARFDADLAAGEHRVLVGELRKLVKSHPLREGLWQRLMLALYRSGRQGEALRAFAEVREILGTQLGIDPSGELAGFEERVLFQDPGLDYEPHSPSNLPAEVSSFVGRVGELKRVTDAVGRHRFVSLKGLGGVGKTRLGIEVGRRLQFDFVGGVWFVDLSGVDEDDDVARHVAVSLGLNDDEGTPSIATVIAWVGDRRVLLLMDNSEQVRSGVSAVVEALTAACPGLHVLTTTRDRIGGPSEFTVEVDGLAVPAANAGGIEDLVATDAGRLIVDRATAVRHDVLSEESDVASLAAICRDLDGLPLALELAAARMNTMSPVEVHERLDQRLRLLSDPKRSGSPRHRALLEALDWSYDLLTPSNREVFATLGVFRGGWTLAAAMEVTGLDEFDLRCVLDDLVDASLVKVHPTRWATRYVMLETVRQFAQHKHAPDDVKRTRVRHVEHFVGMASRSRLMFGGAGQAEALDRLQEETPNLVAALGAARDFQDRQAELRLVASLGRFWFDAGYVSEGLRELSETLAAAEDDPTPDLAKAAEEIAQLYAWNGSLALADRFADKQESIAAAVGTDEVLARVWATRGVLAFARGDYRVSIEHFRAMLPLIESARSESLPFVHASLAFLNLWCGDADSADDHYAQSLRWVREFEVDEGAAIVGDYGGWRSFYAGEHEDAVEQWFAAEAVYAQLRQRTWVVDMQQLQSWVGLIGERGDLAGIRATTAEARKHGLTAFVARGEMLGALALAQQGDAHCGVALGDALEIAAQSGSQVWLFWCLWYGARLVANQGRIADASRVRARAESIRRAIPLALPTALAVADFELVESFGERGPDPGDVAAELQVADLRSLIAQ